MAHSKGTGKEKSSDFNGDQAGRGKVGRDLESKRMEVVTATAQFLRVVRCHEGEVSEYVEIRLVS